jgi:hypothetical protein
MNDYHKAPGFEPIPCLKSEAGACWICERLDRDGPRYDPGFRRLFCPDEFPGQVEALALAGPRGPGLRARLRGFLRSLWREGAQVAAGGAPFSAEAASTARLAICRNCDYFEPGPVRCLYCGCFLRVKVRMPREACPIGRWGPDD